MKTIITTIAILLISLNSFGKGKDIIDVYQTKKIMSIQYGVTCGKTGKPAVYVYHKSRTAKDFNYKTDRELVYTSSLDILYKTVQYQQFIKR